jgi:hypothetical protein
MTCERLPPAAVANLWCDPAYRRLDRAGRMDSPDRLT